MSKLVGTLKVTIGIRPFREVALREMGTADFAYTVIREPEKERTDTVKIFSIEDVDLEASFKKFEDIGIEYGKMHLMRPELDHAFFFKEQHPGFVEDGRPIVFYNPFGWICRSWLTAMLCLSKGRRELKWYELDRNRGWNGEYGGWWRHNMLFAGIAIS